jgi:hypothetical protein
MPTQAAREGECLTFRNQPLHPILYPVFPEIQSFIEKISSTDDFFWKWHAKNAISGINARKIPPELAWFAIPPPAAPCSPFFFRY